ncbi:MAG TPA: 3-phosphoshikimate 1-carboxyvinyltransferase [Kofleriaceae bacterium]|nr:3-phosphoshikimate 1-carboxyvinyltransferase [Kofleriaceae bacterium]
MTTFVVEPVKRPLAGHVQIPGDKSVGHRALLFSLLSETPVHVTGLGDGADNGRSAKAITQLGATITREGGGLIIEGTGLGGMKAPSADIDCGNSGTTIRLLCGLLAGQRFSSILFGDESLSKRPMRRVIEPLAKMGAVIRGQGVGGQLGDMVPPLVVGPAAGPLTGIEYALPVASAQVKSALLLASLWADGVTKLVEPGPSRDHTERMLAHMGAPIVASGRSITLDPAGWNRTLACDRLDVPGDPSSAAFLIAAAVIAGADNVTCSDVGVNPTRTGFRDALAAMHALVEPQAERKGAGEPVADLAVTRGAGDHLSGIEIAGDLTVRAIDEIPILAVVAARAKGRTVVRDAEELRVKESDRVATTAAMLRAFGVEVEERKDGFSLEGVTDRPLRAARVHAHGDHRIAMAAAVAALVADGPTRIDDADNVATSFPGFVDALRGLGATVRVE